MFPIQVPAQAILKLPCCLNKMQNMFGNANMGNILDIRFKVEQIRHLFTNTTVFVFDKQGNYKFLIKTSLYKIFCSKVLTFQKEIRGR